MEIKRIAIIGTGSMGGAILSGLLKSGFAADQISVSTKSTDSAERLADELGVLSFAVENGDDANQMTVAGADVVFVGVKPGAVVDVLADVADSLNDNALIISVAAGITTSAMEAALPEDVIVVRSMPNMPSVIGRGLTGISAGSRAGAAHMKIARELFESVGKVIEVDEKDIDRVSAISGSGPAYVFHFMEALTEAAKHQGFSDEDAATLVNETFLGSVELLIKTGESAAELRRQVTSPKGTTEQALIVINKAELPRVLSEATDAAYARSMQLAAGQN